MRDCAGRLRLPASVIISTFRTNPYRGTATVTVQYYFEDFPVGMTREMQGPALTETEIMEFAGKYDPQYFHVDPERAKESIYGGLIASGWQTVGICMRLVCDAYLLKAASLGSPGVKDVNWRRPVRAGDRLRLKMTVIESKPSQSKPDRGLVLHRWEVFNQRDEQVLDMNGYGMYSRRPAS
ncbi:MAG: MaoC family dehydratase [Betaproteobacteria bacterium]|nr:MaoC family dehydratase [Betaproteobacteria bacterium]